MPVWTQDEAGPYQTIPYPGHHWQPEGEPSKQPHEYAKNGTAKLLTLFHPATGKVCVKGVITCPNAVLHEWLQEQLTQVLTLLPTPPELSPEENRGQWQRWQEGLQVAPSIGDDMPPLRLLLVLDNLSGHHTPSFVMWLCEHGIMPLYTPLGGSWLNMSESIQRIIVRRALDGEHPRTPQHIIDWLEETAEGWNADPTPFVWGGKRKRRRDRARDRRHALGGSGAYSRRVLRYHRILVSQRQEA
ncbi:MAG: hypothetical protein ABI324_24145 [Ktedonobacteraceae bacterium]